MPTQSLVICTCACRSIPHIAPRSHLNHTAFGCFLNRWHPQVLWIQRPRKGHHAILGTWHGAMELMCDWLLPLELLRPAAASGGLVELAASSGLKGQRSTLISGTWLESPTLEFKAQLGTLQPYGPSHVHWHDGCLVSQASRCLPASSALVGTGFCSMDKA